MKTIHLSLLLLLGLIAGVPAARAQTITMTLAHGAPVDHPLNLGALQFARRVAERTGGQVRIEVVPDNQFGSFNDQLQSVRSGALDMSVTPPEYLSKYEKAFAVVLLPYVFDNYDHAHRVLDGPAMAWLAPLAQKQGFVLLNNWEWGFRNLTNNLRPINHPEDLRGLKIRVPPAAASELTMDALGAVTSKFSLSDLQQALAKGVVDGQENPIAVIYFKKLYEVQKYLALTRHVYYNTVHVISARSWARLSPAQQDIVREESHAAGEAVRHAIIGEEEALIVKLERLGMQVTRPDPQAFRAKAAPVYKNISAAVGEANLQQFLKMVEDERHK